MSYLLELPTYKFVASIAAVSWGETLIAIERQIFSRQFAIEYAMAKLVIMDDYPEALLELASLNKDEDIHPFVDDLAITDNGVNDEKLLFIVLAWLYEIKESYDDPLSVVEEVYADFDYPECISGFIRYMPSDEPDLGSIEKNSARLIEKWKSFVDEQSQMYSS